MVDSWYWEYQAHGGLRPLIAAALLPGVGVWGCDESRWDDTNIQRKNEYGNSISNLGYTHTVHQSSSYTQLYLNSILTD